MCCSPNDVFLRQGDFSGGNTYQNKVMRGMRFRVLLDRHMVLEPGVEWVELIAGGFQIIIPGWQITDPQTCIVLQFY